MLNRLLKPRTKLPLKAEDIACAKTDQATFEIRTPPAAGIVCPSHLRQGGFQLSSFVPFRRDAKCPTTRGPNVVHARGASRTRKWKAEPCSYRPVFHVKHRWIPLQFGTTASVPLGGFTDRTQTCLYDSSIALSWSRRIHLPVGGRCVMPRVISFDGITVIPMVG